MLQYYHRYYHYDYNFHHNYYHIIIIIIIIIIIGVIIWHCSGNDIMILSLQVAEEQQHQLAQVRSELADRLLLNRQRLEEEHATLVEAQAQVYCLSAFRRQCLQSKPIIVCLSVAAASKI